MYLGEFLLHRGSAFIPCSALEQTGKRVAVMKNLPWAGMCEKPAGRALGRSLHMAWAWQGQSMRFFCFYWSFMSPHVLPSAAAFFWFMLRPAPVVGGGVGALAFEILRTLSQDWASSSIVPPSPSPSCLDNPPAFSFLLPADLHLPSVLVGVLIGVALGPLIDLLWYLRWGGLSARLRAARPGSRSGWFRPLDE